MGYVEALRVLHRTFHHDPLSARMHILGRFLSCPFLRVLSHLPNEGSILDLGGGHGLFARLAVERSPRRMTVLDPDIRKVLGSYHHHSVQFAAGYLDAIRSSFDAITMFDVLYRIPLDERDPLLNSIHQRLKPGGMLLVKDLDPDHALKSSWNRMQETISDHVFHLTLGEHFAYESNDQFRDRLGRAGFTDCRTFQIGSWYPHAHVLTVATKE